MTAKDHAGGVPLDNRKDPSKDEGSKQAVTNSIPPPTRIREAGQGASATSDKAKQPTVSKPITQSRLINTDIGHALFEVLDAYNTYESDRVDAEVADGAPRPTTHPFHLVGLYLWLKSQEEGTDLPTEDSKPSTGYSKAQRIAEYKQLLNELPPDADTADDVDMGDLPHTLPDYYNKAVDQCRALIEARIKELE